mmetsp:Transcript_4109/g.9334  ORF Transcript_4109/g.9334 Transcript_4109/m.9334 type:complete len:442 (-) Transcript_4109:234-1559(-)|eukprot:CAMPEP_0172306970 /NCGR_PEP_ID=MMETSP1058-20130122/7916_1 /TAXON_ID=83371 /ORGANISM="Detonula confervacea, Strain CCMP 353" /LENGTH=441 /DNA_ID=CAMNT_0013019023 /DNA_START=104 /DNA_END=1429 /DNA_ORIENTATION=+
MKIAQAAVLTTAALIGSADAISIKSLFQHDVKNQQPAPDASAVAAEPPHAATPHELEQLAVADGADRELALANEDGAERDLQSNCYQGQAGSTTYRQPAAAWHPTYSQGWAGGECRYTVDCNSPAYSTQLQCCRGAYAGQTSGYCVSKLPSPPTTSPTNSGGLDVYYPDYSTDWTNAYCKNEYPMPNGWPTYSTMLACCKGAYGGQATGKCLSMLPSPPTTSPTNSAFETDFYYPVYEVDFGNSGCSNKLPLPYRNKNDRPFYDTMLACCKGAYAGQTSGVCLSQLPSPPSTSPTGSGGMDFYYADRDTDYQFATCKNDRPVPYLPGARREFASMLECCKANYGSQQSGACLSQLPSPPTQNPTNSAGAGATGWYPDRGATTCSLNGNTNEKGYPTKMACCSNYYGWQSNQQCFCEADPCYSCQCSGASVAGACPALTCTP